MNCCHAVSIKFTLCTSDSLFDGGNGFCTQYAHQMVCHFDGDGHGHGEWALNQRRNKHFIQLTDILPKLHLYLNLLSEVRDLAARVDFFVGEVFVPVPEFQ